MAPTQKQKQRAPLGEAGVEGLGMDANGFPKTYAFLTIESTEVKLNKCTSMLSGALWKGHKLRIAPAREDYQTRLAAERAAAAAEALKPVGAKKRKRNPDATVGYKSKHFELVTAENVKKHRGWTLDPTPVPAPLFPIVARPSHPLPEVPRAAATSWTRGATKAKASKAARAALRTGAPMINTLTRARRVRIDPRKWGRKKVIFEDGKEGWVADSMAGTWECEDEIIGEGNDARVRWIFKAKDGSVRRSEVVNLTQRSVPHTDRFTALLEGLNRPAPQPEPTVEQPIVEEMKVVKLLDDYDDEDAPLRKRVKSASPPPYIPSAPRTLLYNEEDTFALLESTRAADELAASRKKEKDAQLKLLQGLLAAEKVAAEAAEEAAATEAEQPVEEVAVEVKTSRPMPQVEGFADDDDDDLSDILRLRGGAASNEDEDEQFGEEVLRLRGGAADSDSSDDSSDTEDEEDVKMDAEEQAPKHKTTLAFGTLKDMFKPQEADAGFSLLSGLDLELEPLERTPSPPPVPVHRFTSGPSAVQAKPFVPPSALGRSNRAWVGTGAITPFFAFPSGPFEDREGRVVEGEAQKLGMDEAASAALRESSAKTLGAVAGTFWRSETTEEIEAQHQKLRESLRGVSRKRHREAAKRERKKGAAKRATGGGGAAVAGPEEA
ncbi:hypothetical protein BCR35DRAFT_300792 [Leucosporidium creatinivorum]|uniref:Uncharacterized protein n=1 Tax=Leucosporidium creatinivorum TaxID=106004 RepID=A0A1Y2FY79_9BASI|nr:hypothetical protein BCR35DRAFT_300792 [Leucosporidium creatinivorum]